MRGIPARQVLADRAYDADRLYDLNSPAGRRSGHTAAPPSQHHPYHALPTRGDGASKAFFAKLKQWRRIATRCDKLAAIFLGFIKLATIMLWHK